VVYGVKKTKIT